MAKALDLTGQKFGRLTAMYREPSRNGKTYWYCKCECGGEKSVQTCHLKAGTIQSCGCLTWEANQEKAKKQSLMIEISDEDFALIVQNSFSIAEVARKCGYSNIGGASSKIVKDRIEKQELSTVHFTRQQLVKRTFENVFIENSTASQSTLRRMYLDGKYSKYECSICGLEPFWNGKELTLTLDHINGINNDDRLENLRWVCPNCDRQLDTFAGKNNKNK